MMGTLRIGLVLCSEHMPSYTHMTDEHEERNVPVVYHDLNVLTIYIF